MNMAITTPDENENDKFSVIIADVLLQLTDNIDCMKSIRTGEHPQFGQFVLTGISFAPPVNRIGFCVQVRRGVGQFGSDVVFLRHADGSLCVHENNSYFALNDEQEALARSVFCTLPEDEGEDNVYGDTQGVREQGFVIESSASKPTQDGHAVALTLIKT